MHYITIDLSVRNWQTVDGIVDNSMAVDVIDDVVESLIIGSCVRDAGWRAAATSGLTLDRHGWPPEHDVLPIVLRHEHWQWVLSQLERWSIYDVSDLSTEVRSMIAATLDSSTE